MLESIVNYITTVSGDNQMVAGAITLAFSGAAAWLFKQLPRTLASVIKAQLITTMTFNNAGWQKEQTFVKISDFLSQLTTESGSRTLTVDSVWMDGKDLMVMSMGYGKHFFFYRGRFMWLDRTQLESGGSERQKEQIRLSVLGRKHAIFKDLIEDNSPKEDSNVINFSEFKDNSWLVKGKINKRPMKSLALNPKTREMFVSNMDHFLNNKEEFYKLGLPHKMTWVLHGVPGSGKSSIIRSLASDYDMNVCNLPLSGLSDNNFRDAVMSAPSNSIIVIEDFDSCDAVSKRGNVSGEEDDAITKEVKQLSFLTLSGILNTLDGVVSLDGKIVILTTNCIESVDTALLRAGRVDQIIELPKIDGAAVKSYFEGLYDVTIDFECPILSAKDINSIVFKCRNDWEKVEQSLIEQMKG